MADIKPGDVVMAGPFLADHWNQYGLHPAGMRIIAETDKALDLRVTPETRLEYMGKNKWKRAAE